MLLGKCFEKFSAQSPVSVMVRGTLERVFDPEKGERVFADNAVLQYPRALTFAQCVGLMSDVVFRIAPSVGAWYKAHREELTVTRQAVYDKLKRRELPIAAGLVQYAGRELGACLRQMPAPPPPLLRGYRVRVLDGNHLAGTEHRLGELRRYRAAALPGPSLVFYDPQWDLVTEVIPCEDAYAQERSLLPEVLAKGAARDCMVADRNFCTTGFLFGLAHRGAFFVIRQHAATLTWHLQGPRRYVGQDERGQALYEQALGLTAADTGATLVTRRITIELLTPTRQSETALHILPNLPPADAPARQVAALYGDRWTIETAFQHLTLDLQCEVDTLGYPKAALLYLLNKLGCGSGRSPRCSQVELLGALVDDAGQGGDLIGAGDPVMDIRVEIHPQLLRRRGQRHEGIPCLRALARPWAKADRPLAHPLACSQFGRVVMQRDFRVLQHHQQAAFLGVRQGNAFIQRPIARHRGEQRIERCRQARALLRCRMLAIGQQLIVEVPEVVQEIVQQRAVERHNGHQLFIMPPLMHPAQCQLLGHPGELQRAVTDQQANHGAFRLRVIGRHGRRSHNPFACLRPELGQVFSQQVLQEGCVQLLIAGKRGQFLAG